MMEIARRRGRQGIAAEPRQTGTSIFEAIAAAEAHSYNRDRDLPGLIALWPRELADKTREGGLLIVAKLRRALRAERRRARAGHWSYDLNRHLGLMGAYKGEIALLSRNRPPVAARPRPGADKPRPAATLARSSTAAPR
jgi:hypothetical protein